MSYQIETIPPFEKAVKRLTKKYRHIKQDLQVLVGTLSANPSLRQAQYKSRGWLFLALPIRCGRYGWPAATFERESVVGIE